jgi:Arc/MetJ-type ribon-helix-helix transcriptional regulator
MEILIRPELEAAIREDVQRGAYTTMDEYVEQAVAMLQNRRHGSRSIAPELPPSSKKATRRRNAETCWSRIR